MALRRHGVTAGAVANGDVAKGDTGIGFVRVSDLAKFVLRRGIGPLDPDAPGE
jgi:hypothetical protein